jgi:hypothetical protein
MQTSNQPLACQYHVEFIHSIQKVTARQLATEKMATCHPEIASSMI